MQGESIIISATSLQSVALSSLNNPTILPSTTFLFTLVLLSYHTVLPDVPLKIGTFNAHSFTVLILQTSK